MLASYPLFTERVEAREKGMLGKWPPTPWMSSIWLGEMSSGGGVEGRELGGMKRRLCVGHGLTMVMDEARLCSPWKGSSSAGSEGSLLRESWLSLVSVDLVKMVRDLEVDNFSIARCSRELY